MKLDLSGSHAIEMCLPCIIQVKVMCKLLAIYIQVILSLLRSLTSFEQVMSKTFQSPNFISKSFMIFFIFRFQLSCLDQSAPDISKCKNVGYTYIHSVKRLSLLLNETAESWFTSGTEIEFGMEIPNRTRAMAIWVISIHNLDKKL